MKIAVAEARPLHCRDALKRSDFANIAGSEMMLDECLYRSSVRYICYVDNLPACVWGLIPRSLLSDQAFIWLLTTDVAAEHKFLLVRHSQIFVERALRSYSTLFGFVEPGNISAKRWLKWLGAEFGQIDERGVHFRIRKS